MIIRHPIMRSHSSIISLTVSLCLAVALLPKHAQAAYAPLTFRYTHFVFEIDPDDYPAWRSSEESWLYFGEPFLPPGDLRVDGDVLPSLPQGVSRSSNFTWDLGAIRSTLELQIARLLDREPGSVTIRRDGDNILFEGVGLSGRRVDLAEAAQLTAEAMRRGILDITLPVAEIQPQMNVLDAELQDQGIREVVAVGESDYRGSPLARTHNIATGLDRFNGHIVPQGALFSFNEVLGPVNASTGYKKELVIQGDKTVPDYGGGLCQISTTAYRGVWEYGFPIRERVNHSYSVRYYFPEGTDATIYPPYKDVQFFNDSPGDLLIQTYSEDGRAYFIYYGTRDKREAEVMGPYVWGKVAPPADRIEQTTDIAPGTSRKVGERVPGLKAGWLRVVYGADGETEEELFYSTYEARPRYTQLGVTEEELHPPDPVPEPVQQEVKKEEEPSARPSWFKRWRRRHYQL